MKIENEWEVINRLINIRLCNQDGLEWQIAVGVYTDNTRKLCRGGDIGTIVNGKFVPTGIDDDYDYQCVWTANGNVIFLRKKKAVDNAKK